MRKLSSLLASLACLLTTIALAQAPTAGRTTPVAGTNAGWGWLWFVLVVAAVILIVAALNPKSRRGTPPRPPL